MKASKHKISERIAGWAFYLLFPGFFFYQFAIARDYMPRFLGSYFPLLSVIFLPLLFVLSFNKVVKPFNLVKIVFYSIIFLTSVVALVNFSLQLPNNYSYEMFEWTISGLIYNLVGFLIASNFKVKNPILLFFILFLMFLTVIFNIGDRGIFYVMLEASDTENIATYQGFARSIIVVSLMLLVFFFEKKIWFYTVFLIGVITLFFNGARTELALFILSFIFFNLIYISLSLKNFFSVLLLFFFVSILLMSFINDIAHSRMMGLLDVANDESVLARNILTEYALTLISNSPVMGDYGAYTEIGSTGSYPHNILSSWINLGLLGFCLYVLLFFMLWKDAITGFFSARKRNTVEYKMFLIFLFIVTVALLAAKNHTYIFVGFVVGFYHQYIFSRNNF